jgi:ubiquinone/menaquinone biosynthesis C-methylase UbiE
MLERVLEPEVMDTEEDAREYDAMDFSEANARFAADACALVLGLATPAVVDLGTGPGDIPIEIVRRVPGARVVAVDLAESMLEVARRKVAAAGVTSAVELLRGDVKATGLRQASFDLVVSNSTAHHLPDPLSLFREVARIVRPGGAFLIRDLFRPPTVEAARAVVERVAPNDSPRQKRLFLDSLFAALTLDEVRDLAHEAGLRGARVAVVSDRHWTVERARHADAGRPPGYG